MPGPEQPPDKRCTRCGAVKPATTQFWYCQPRLRGGLSNQCKPCVAAIRRTRRAADRPKYREQQRRERDSDGYRQKHRKYEQARRAKLGDSFRAQRRAYYDRKLKSRRIRIPLSAEEKRRRALAAQKKHWTNNREQYRTRTRNYLARKKMARGTHTEADIDAQIALQGFLCFWCSADIAGGRHHVDHFIPLSRGGSNGPENLVCACGWCNRSKGKKLPDEFLAYLTRHNRQKPSIISSVSSNGLPKSPPIAGA